MGLTMVDWEAPAQAATMVRAWASVRSARLRAITSSTSSLATTFITQVKRFKRTGRQGGGDLPVMRNRVCEEVWMARESDSSTMYHGLQTTT